MMIARRLISMDDLRGQPDLSQVARDQLVRGQPTTVVQALRIRGVGRSTTKRLLALGLLTDPDQGQNALVPGASGRT
jgi:tRNA U34 5-carboxymethylaminomethyl modifying enzyme MnmG/GidA